VSAYPAEVLADILVGKPFRTPFLEGYLTPGGSYILASPACMTDDGTVCVTTLSHRSTTQGCVMRLTVPVRAGTVGTGPETSAYNRQAIRLMAFFDSLSRVARRHTKPFGGKRRGRVFTAFQAPDASLPGASSRTGSEASMVFQLRTYLSSEEVMV